LEHITSLSWSVFITTEHAEYTEVDHHIFRVFCEQMRTMAKHLRTSDLAKAVGVHPNTVRRYVEWGLLPPVERSPSGYRRFTQHHLDCLRIARMIYGGSFYPGRALRRSGVQVIQRAVAGDMGGALNLSGVGSGNHPSGG
jgi:hypothetical protein